MTARASYRFQIAAGVQRTDGDLAVPDQDFVTSVWTVRANYSFSTRMFTDTLLQYLQERDLFNVNVRFNPIHHPLSDIYLVYNEQRFTTPDAPNSGRGVILKFTQMFAF